MFHAKRRTSARVRVVRVFSRPSRVDPHAVCSARRYGRRNACPTSSGAIQRSSTIGEPVTVSTPGHTLGLTITRKIDFTTDVVVCSPSDSALPFTCSPSAQATTLIVPDQVPTIQGAIDAVVVPEAFANAPLEESVGRLVEAIDPQAHDAFEIGEGGGTNFGVYARIKDGHTWSEAMSAMPAVIESNRA